MKRRSKEKHQCSFTEHEGGTEGISEEKKSLVKDRDGSAETKLLKISQPSSSPSDCETSGAASRDDEKIPKLQDRTIKQFRTLSLLRDSTLTTSDRGKSLSGSLPQDQSNNRRWDIQLPFASSPPRQSESFSGIASVASALAVGQSQDHSVGSRQSFHNIYTPHTYNPVSTFQCHETKKVRHLAGLKKEANKELVFQLSENDQDERKHVFKSRDAKSASYRLTSSTEKNSTVPVTWSHAQVKEKALFKDNISHDSPVASSNLFLHSGGWEPISDPYKDLNKKDFSQFFSTDIAVAQLKAPSWYSTSFPVFKIRAQEEKTKKKRGKLTEIIKEGKPVFTSGSSEDDQDGQKHSLQNFLSHDTKTSFSRVTYYPHSCASYPCHFHSMVPSPRIVRVQTLSANEDGSGDTNQKWQSLYRQRYKTVASFSNPLSSSMPEKAARPEMCHPTDVEDDSPQHLGVRELGKPITPPVAGPSSPDLRNEPINWVVSKDCVLRSEGGSEIDVMHCASTKAMPCLSDIQFSHTDFWGDKTSSPLTRSLSVPSQNKIQGQKRKTSTRSESLPNMMLQTSFEDFTPDIADEENDGSYSFRCSRRGLYRCSVTGLLFHMDGEGEVVYRTVPWNRRLLAQRHMKPAGPLFDIKCVQQSVCQLHLPHCEISSTGCHFLSVAHVTDEGIEFILPHKTTETHVIINITGFSGFGNVKDEDSPPVPVRALVLLFYRPSVHPNVESLINVLLLPRNVVLRDVLNARQNLDGGERYIETPSQCKLKPDQVYTLSTCPEDDLVLVQPSEAEFDCDSYVNFISSFQVILEKVMKHIKLVLSDSKSSDVVWERRVFLLATEVKRSCGQSLLNLPSKQRLNEVRSSFIEGISGPVLKSLLDKLLEKKVITDSEMDSVDGIQDKRDKARVVIDTVRRKGEAASSEMIEFLCKEDPFFSEHLGLV